MQALTHFSPRWWLRNRHLQTCMAKLSPRPIQKTRLDCIELPDGDLLQLHWLDAADLTHPYYYYCMA